MSYRSNRKDKVDPEVSFRWPHLLADPEQVDRLLANPEWQVLCQDLMQLLEERQSEVIHKLPTTMEAQAQENFLRGKISVYEDLLGLKEEAEQWKQTLKKGK